MSSSQVLGTGVRRRWEGSTRALPPLAARLLQSYRMLWQWAWGVSITLAAVSGLRGLSSAGLLVDQHGEAFNRRCEDLVEDREVGDGHVCEELVREETVGSHQLLDHSSAQDGGSHQDRPPVLWVRLARHVAADGEAVDQSSHVSRRHI